VRSFGEADGFSWFCVALGKTSIAKEQGGETMRKSVLLTFVMLFASISGAQEPISVAAMDFDRQGVDGPTAKFISEQLRWELTQTGAFRVMERGTMLERLGEEISFQASGLCDQSCLVEIGQFIGVDRMIGGTVYKLGSTYRIIIRMINVETTELVLQHQDRASSLEQLTSATVKSVASQFAALVRVAEQTGRPHKAADELARREREATQRQLRRQQEAEQLMLRQERESTRRRAAQCERAKAAALAELNRTYGEKTSALVYGYLTFATVSLGVTLPLRASGTHRVTAARIGGSVGVGVGLIVWSITHASRQASLRSDKRQIERKRCDIQPGLPRRFALATQAQVSINLPLE
jgi:hypothetical protein